MELLKLHLARLYASATTYVLHSGQHEKEALRKRRVCEISRPRRLERLSHQLVILQRLSVSARATPSPTGKNATISTARTNQLSMLPVSKMHM